MKAGLKKWGLAVLLGLALCRHAAAHETLPDGFVVVDTKTRTQTGRLEVCTQATFSGCKKWGTPQQYVQQAVGTKEAVLTDMTVSMGGKYGDVDTVILYYRIEPR